MKLVGGVRMKLVGGVRMKLVGGVSVKPFWRELSRCVGISAAIDLCCSRHCVC